LIKIWKVFLIRTTRKNRTPGGHCSAKIYSCNLRIIKRTNKANLAYPKITKLHKLARDDNIVGEQLAYDQKFEDSNPAIAGTGKDEKQVMKL